MRILKNILDNFYNIKLKIFLLDISIFYLLVILSLFYSLHNFQKFIIIIFIKSTRYFYPYFGKDNKYTVKYNSCSHPFILTRIISIVIIFRILALL